MAEPLSYESTPFTSYLKEVNIPEQALEDNQESTVPSSSSPSSLPNPQVERLKYTLATSALLSPSLSDVLELCPPLHTLVRGKRKETQIVTWPREWETVGHSWQDRDALTNTRCVLKGLVEIVKKVSQGEPPRIDTRAISKIVAGRSTRQDKERAGDVPSQILDEFVQRAHLLDRRIEEVLNGLEWSEEQGTSSSFSRSHSTPPSTPPRIRSPPPSTTRPSQIHEQLATELSTLLRLYQSATTKLSSLLPTSILPILPPPSSSSSSTPKPSPPRSSPLPRLRAKTHQPTASLSELHRHASQAMQERQEVEKWETGSAISDSSTPLIPSSPLPPSSSSSSSTTAAWSPRLRDPSETEGTTISDPFHPTVTYFGGLERKSSTRSNASTSSATERLSSSQGARHRLRPSVGTAGAFGVGTAAWGSAAGGVSPLLREVGSRNRKRPQSMGGWIESSPIFVPPSPLQRAEGRSEEVGGEGIRRRGEDELRSKWEMAHMFRKGFVWNLIAVFEEGIEEEERWGETRKALKEVVDGLDKLARRIEKLHPGVRGTRLSASTQDTRRQQERGATASRPSSLHVCTPKLPHHQHRPSRSSIIVTPYSPSSPHPGSLLTQSSLARSTGPSSNFLPPNSLVRPIRQPDFAPPSSGPSPTAQALSSYESSHATLSHSLRTLQTALDSIAFETRLLSPLAPLPAPSTSTVEAHERVVELLRAHDSIKEELQNLAVEWATSRITLRQAVGIELNSNTTKVTGLGIEASSKDAEENGMSDELDQDDAPPEAGDVSGGSPTNASLDDGRLIEDLDLTSRQSMLDAALSSSFQPNSEEDSKEKIFEAVVGERERNGGSRGEKLGREERIKRIKEAREALDVGKRAAGTGGGEHGGSGGFEAQQKMVGELREVLKGLGKVQEV